MKVHVAVLGTGAWSRVHLAALADSPHVSRVTLVGRNASAREALAAEFPVVATTVAAADAALSDPSVDVVDIVLPHHLHAALSTAALDAGKHVICEKPSALTLDSFDAVAEQAAAVCRRRLVVMNQLFNPINQRVGELIREGAIGRPFLLIENGYSNHARYYRDAASWRTRWETAGGGVLIDGGFHMVYKQLSWLAGCGYPSWITAAAEQLAVDPGGQQVAEQGEDFISYTAGYAEPLRISGSHAWTLAGDVRNGRLGFVAGSEATIELTGQEDAPLRLTREGQAESVAVPAGPTTNIATMHACLQDYVRALATGDETTYGDTELTRRALELVLAVYESGRSGQRVALSPSP